MDRRTLVRILALGAADLIVGCARDSHSGMSSADYPRRATPFTVTRPMPTPLVGRTSVPTMRGEAPVAPTSPPAPAPTVREEQRILFNAPGSTRQVALTIDDGFNATAVTGYIDFARRTNIPLSLAPNGMYHSVWNPHADAVRSLIDAGQVTMVNHTWSHRSIRTLSDSALRSEVERNDDWIMQAFGVSSRPWFRPPYGEHNERSRAVLAELGYSRILMWSGSVGDAKLGVTTDELITATRESLRPGAIVLGHANQRVVVNLYGELEKLIAQRALVPVTVSSMFASSPTAHLIG